MIGYVRNDHHVHAPHHHPFLPLSFPCCFCRRAAPRFTRNGEHVFETIGKKHGASVNIDPNFKVGARSKKDPTVWVAADTEQAGRRPN